MIDVYRKILQLLNVGERRRLYLLFFLFLVSGFAEAAGVASVMPFIAIASNPEVIQENDKLHAVYQLIAPSNIKSFILILGFASMAAIILSVTLRAVTEYAEARFAAMRGHSISCRILENCLSRPYVWFLNRHSADLGQSILSEVHQVVAGVLLPGLRLLAKSATVAAILLVLAVVEPRVTLLAAAGIGGCYAILYGSSRKYLSRIGADRVSANQERYMLAQEVFGGIKDVKVAGLERSYLSQFRDPSSRFAHHQASATILAALPRFAIEAIVFCGMLLLVMFFVAFRGAEFAEMMPIIGLYAFAGYRLLPSINEVFQSFTKLRFNEPALNRIISEARSDNAEHIKQDTCYSAAKKLRLRNRLEMKTVNFTYPEAKSPALKDLTLAISARTTVGFVGASGAGKTTAIDVILGLLTPQSGELRVDGRTISEVNKRSWQKTIGYVSQHIFLADDTIARNIAFGVSNERIDQASLERAARLAELHDFISQELPRGYQTMVGERGVRLSGGQRQRIGIARALYNDPDTLVFDEATSALDNLTEQAVMEAVHKLAHKKTIIIVAHRLTTVRQCDEIFMFDAGRLSASGTYDQLLRDNRAFHAMAKPQAEA